MAESERVDPATDAGHLRPRIAVLPAAPVELRVEGGTRLSSALEQNHLPLVRRLSVEHRGTERLEDLTLTVRLGLELAPPLVLRLDALAPGDSWQVHDLELALDGARLRRQEERELTTLTVELEVPGCAVLRHEQPLELLAWNEWSGLGFAPELVAAFVLPNQPALDPLLQRAGEHLGAATGSTALDGYQRPGRARPQLWALWAALAERGLTYANPPASFELQGQKVRLPERLLGGGLGTCLDLTLLGAALLEQCGLNPLLIFLRGHVFLGLWLADEAFPEAVVEDGLRLRKRVQLGEIEVLETTLWTAGPQATAEAAKAAAERQLEDLEPFECAVDLRAARRERIRPLATRSGTERRADQPTGSAASVPFATTPNVTPSAEAPAAAVASPPAAAAAPLTAAPLTAAPLTTAPLNAASSPAPNLAPTATPAERRLDAWKRRLLDLSLRNRLLAFRETQRTLPIAALPLAELEDSLAAGVAFELRSAEDFLARTGRSAPLATARGGEDPRRAYLVDELCAGRLRIDLPAADLERRTLELYRAARTSLEESGANTLHLALGFLEWREARDPQRVLRAPLWLLPLELERLPLGRGYRLRAADDEPRCNETLLEKLSSEYGLDTAPLAETLTDGAGLDVPALLHRWRSAVRDRDGWDVVERAQVGLFSFAKFLMWRDLELRREQLLQSRVVRFLVERPDEAFDGPDEGPREAADLRSSFLPLDSDSSQTAAVEQALRGRSFVLEGPPGTGKSQTIANLIAQALAQGQRVLFVAEKRAALEVVQRRLEQIGLGPFCLELHSDKVAKREVVEHLAQLLELAQVHEPRDVDRRADELSALTGELDGHVRSLHTPFGPGVTLYEVLGRALAARDQPAVELALERPLELTGPAADHLQQALAALVRAASLVEPGEGHPLAAVGRRSLTPADLGAVERAGAALGLALDTFELALARWRAWLGLPERPARSVPGHEQAALGELAEALVEGPDPGAALLAEPELERWSERFGELAAQARAALAARRELLGRWTPEFLDGDPSALQTEVTALRGAFLLRRWFGRRRLERRLQPFRRGGGALELDPLASDLRRLHALRDEERELDASGAGRLLGAEWRRDEAELERSAARCARALRLVRTLPVLGGDDGALAAPLRARLIELCGPGRSTLAAGGPGRRAAEEYRAARAAAEQTYAAWSQLLVLDRERLRGADDRGPWLDHSRRLLAALREAGSRLRDWCLWQEARATAEEAEGGVLGPLATAVSRGELPPSRAAGAFERALCERWAEAAIAADPALARFHGAEHGHRVDRFRALDRAWLEATRQRLLARLTAHLPRAGQSTSDSSEVGLLLRERRKKRGHLSVRRLFERLPNLLPELVPCALVSPLSVAQFLDTGWPPFDLVVFDEASQIPVWDGVGALARARAAVVVGDSQQLPPTSFFERLGGEEEGEPTDDDECEELESLLDECVASRLPRCTLDWHYRSRHESLIAFSNAEYYGGRLETFPAPRAGDRELGLTWRWVEGAVYDRSHTRTNRGEAEALVAHTLELLTGQLDAGAQRQSVGLVTFSLAQQRLVEELLEVARAAHPELEPWFDPESDEPLFVKNLENVQGDERDRILLSVGYGPDAGGRFAMNFGPLNRRGGERRLNVAITRARCALTVFSSFRPEAIDLSRSGALGVRQLKAYLEFAARGAEALALGQSPQQAPPTELATQVAAALAQRGHHLGLQVGRGRFRVDLAVIDPADPARALLGFTLDGSNYARASNARDRDRLRHSVLERLGWRLETLWALDWYADPRGVLERAERAIDAAQRAAREAPGPRPGSTIAAAATAAGSAGSGAPAASAAEAEPIGPGAALEPPSLEAALEADEPAPPAPGHEPYRVARLRSQASRSERLLEASELPRLGAALAAVVAVEGPVHRDLALRRVAASYGQSRLGARVSAQLLASLASLPPAERPVLRGDFLWAPSSAAEDWRSFRVSDPSQPPPREPNEWPPEELSAALHHVLRQNVALGVTDLAREVGSLFGFARLGARVERRVRAAVDAELAAGRVEWSGEQLRARGPAA
jgi:hypothetical protein